MAATTKVFPIRQVQNLGETMTIDLTGLGLPASTTVALWLVYKARPRGTSRPAPGFIVRAGTVTSLGSSQTFTPTVAGVYTPIFIAIVGPNRRPRTFKGAPVIVKP